MVLVLRHLLSVEFLALILTVLGAVIGYYFHVLRKIIRIIRKHTEKRVRSDKKEPLEPKEATAQQ